MIISYQPHLLAYQRHAGSHGLQANARPVLPGPAVESQHRVAAAEEIGQAISCGASPAHGGGGPHFRGMASFQPIADRPRRFVRHAGQNAPVIRTPLVRIRPGQPANHEILARLVRAGAKGISSKANAPRIRCPMPWL